MIPSPGSQGDATRKISAFVYLLRSQERPRYYIGWTTDIWRRLAEHNRRQRSAYISSHRPWQLVGYEAYPTAEAAKQRERTLKRNPRMAALFKKRLLTARLCSRLPQAVSAR